MPSIPFLYQRDFVAPPDEYIPRRCTDLTIEEIAAAYSPLPNGMFSHSTQRPPSDTLDDSEPRLRIKKMEVNYVLDTPQLHIIQTAPSTAALQETVTLMESITL